MKRLLIVDDEDKIREVIKEYAEFSGYVAEEAADGMSAIGMVKLNDYDLIIMDVMMPKLRRLQCCQGDPEDQEHSGDHAFSPR